MFSQDLNTRPKNLDEVLNHQFFHPQQAKTTMEDKDLQDVKGEITPAEMFRMLVINQY